MVPSRERPRSKTCAAVRGRERAPDVRVDLAVDVAGGRLGAEAGGIEIRHFPAHAIGARLPVLESRAAVEGDVAAGDRRGQPRGDRSPSPRARASSWSWPLAGTAGVSAARSARSSGRAASGRRADRPSARPASGAAARSGPTPRSTRELMCTGSSRISSAVTPPRVGDRQPAGAGRRLHRQAQASRSPPARCRPGVRPCAGEVLDPEVGDRVRGELRGDRHVRDAQAVDREPAAARRVGRLAQDVEQVPAAVAPVGRDLGVGDLQLVEPAAGGRSRGSR